VPSIRDLIVLDDPVLTYRRGRSKFRVAAPLRLAWNYGSWHRRLTVPPGADTNGPSVVPFFDDSLIAATVHDYLASTRGTSVGRAEADALAREIKRRGNVSGWRAWLGWLGARAFGWLKWHGDVDSRETTADGRIDPAREAPACEGG
jgi:Protein of unknown function (DUF1353)